MVGMNENTPGQRCNGPQDDLEATAIPVVPPGVTSPLRAAPRVLHTEEEIRGELARLHAAMDDQARKCPVCDGTFWPTRADALTCSNRCRMRMSRLRRKGVRVGVTSENPDVVTPVTRYLFPGLTRRVPLKTERDQVIPPVNAYFPSQFRPAHIIPAKQFTEYDEENAELYLKT
jgi:hypothetical protein